MKMGMAAKPIPEGATLTERSFFDLLALIRDPKTYDNKLRSIIDERTALEAEKVAHDTRENDLRQVAAALDEREQANARLSEKLAGIERRLEQKDEALTGATNKLADERAQFEKETETRRLELDRREAVILKVEADIAARLAAAEKAKADAEALKIRYDAKVTAAARLLNEAG